MINFYLIIKIETNTNSGIHKWNSSLCLLSYHIYYAVMSSKTTISLSIIAIAATVLLFASGPIVGNQLVFAGGDNHHHH
jgi:hypothetical protein